MQQKREGKRHFMKWAILAAVVLLAVWGLRIILGRPSFDADKVAQAETRM